MQHELCVSFQQRREKMFPGPSVLLTPECVYVCVRKRVQACLCVCDLESIAVRSTKGLQLETKICMLRRPCCSESCGA